MHVVLKKDYQEGFRNDIDNPGGWKFNTDVLEDSMITQDASEDLSESLKIF